MVLPEHLHTIWTLPPGDADYPARWKSIKSHFVRGLAKSGQNIMKRKDGSALVWQRRYWEHTVRDEQDFRQHVDYIHLNPVKHGCAMRPADWPYSSFHRYVRQGVLPANWGAGGVGCEGEFGEPGFAD